MRKTFLLTLLLLAAPAAPASASGFSMAWDQCFESGGASQRLFACDADTGMDVLAVSVVPPADMPQFMGASVIIGVFVTSGDLPPWWQTAAGQCRADAIVPSFDPTALPLTPDCPSLWGDTVPVQGWVIQQGLDGPGTFRINSAASVPPGYERMVYGNVESYLVEQVIFLHAKTVGADACEGCGTGACLRLTELTLSQPAGVGDYVVYNEAYPGSSGATFNAQGGNNSPCATPTVNRTWGAVKSLYR